MIITFNKGIFRILLFSVIVMLCCHTFPLFSQVSNDFGFSRTYYYPAVSNNNTPLSLPWVGGLNSCQFNETDLNFDGIKDLVVFEKVGDRILTFINQGIQDSVNYQYEPEYEKFFPASSGWLILKDYNCDGKEDIFTYGYGGIKVFKNTSSPSSGLSFELITNQLLSYMYNGYVNIFVRDVDYPAIADIDGDGDLDILAFWILGTYVHYHENLGMDDYGSCDSLKFRLNSSCWGYIKEGDTSNYITLNAPCPSFKISEPESDLNMPLSEGNPFDIEHVGSTLLCLDLNADSLQDLLIGDVDYPSVIGLINGGSKDTARIIIQDNHFPSYDTSVNICSFPVMTTVDVNNDAKRDLIVSPFDASTLISESDHSVWYYRNLGSDNQPDFHLETKEFLQGEMIEAGSYAMPVFCDVNQDGLQDIVIGNYGYFDSSYYSNGYLYSVFRSKIAVLYNTGSLSSPSFNIGDQDFAGISALNITNAYPAFGDLDGDGDLDMLLGCTEGDLFFFRNIAGQGNPMHFDPPINAYQGIDVGNCSTPQLWDLDKDGKPDLMIGNKKGLLSYYHNTGTLQTPVFTFITDSLGKVDVRNPALSWEGNSIPCFFKGTNDSTLLFVGSLQGGVSYYKGIDGHLSDTFSLVGHNYLYMNYSPGSSVTVNDLDQDGFVDLIMGNCRGGLAYFKGTIPGPIGIPESHGIADIQCRLYPNPAKDFCIIDVPGMEHFTKADYMIFNAEGRFTDRGSLTSFPSRILAPSSDGLYFINLTFYESNKNIRLTKPLKLVVIH